jgi:hypothetical protein
LVKAIVATWPVEFRPSGYHLESIAIEAFKTYSDALSYDAMLTHFFGRASSIVMSPIVDRSGQSRHVDEYLGEPGSDRRRAMSHLFDNTARRMFSSAQAGAIGVWQDLFEE